MRKHRISDRDAFALLKGRASAARSDLAPLAESVSKFRAAAFTTLPQPSAELALRLDLSRATGISSLIAPLSDVGTVEAYEPAVVGGASPIRRVKSMFAWFAGLGIAVKIVLGLAVTAAAVAGAGAAGVLPPLAPISFDTAVTSTADPTGTAEPTSSPTGTPTATPSDDPTHSSDKSDKSKSENELGKEISEEAKEIGEDAGKIDAPDSSVETDTKVGATNGGVEIGTDVKIKSGTHTDDNK